MFSLNSTFVSEPNDSHFILPFFVITIRFVPPTANFIYPFDESRILYDSLESVVATKLDAFGGKSCLRALSEKSHRIVETERFYMKKSAIRIPAAFFSRKTNLSTNAWLVLFASRRGKQNESERVFPWSGSAFTFACFSTKDCEKQYRTQGIFFFFFYWIRKEKERSYVPVYSFSI